MRDSPEYELTYLDFLQTQPICRVLLPDTLGILTLAETYLFAKKLVIRYPRQYTSISTPTTIMTSVWPTWWRPFGRAHSGR